MSLLRFWSGSIAIQKHRTRFSCGFFDSSQGYASRKSSRNFSSCLKPNQQNGAHFQSSSLPKHFPLSGMEDALMGYLFGKKKATDVAHMVWRHLVQKGDTVVDATCGNGYDTLAMLKLVADDSHKGYVYALDIQKDALDMTSSLLDDSLNPTERQFIKLFNICHSKMEEVIPIQAPVRLIAFNLGYLPGGDKEIITRSETTLLALEAAKRILMAGGLISLVVYVGHPGGWEELESIEGFAARLPTENWVCCKLQMLNRPSAPIPIFLFKR